MSEQDEEVTVDTSTEDEEATDSNEISEQEDTEVQEEEEVVPKKQYNQVFSRAKRAEDELKKLKESKANPPINNDPQLSDELKLIARGLSDEEIEQAKVIAKGKGIALTEAIKDSLFTIFQSDLKEKLRKEKAKLGASKGSGESADSSFIKPGMSRDEHQEAFKKAMGI
jgi:hypothetical protein